MSLLSMRVFGYDLQLELIPANQRMIMHEDYEELAVSVMSMVDLLVHKTRYDSKGARRAIQTGTGSFQKLVHNYHNLPEENMEQDFASVEGQLAKGGFSS
ncbi:hypothetical protein NC652_024250 [Populus alba x Populus x berolinensis]|nr:hypothetical protein NC652_024250 [Populus alba x Populus x berolinensis]